MIVYKKEEAKIINGIAIILMLIHHFFGFPEFLTHSNKFSYIFTFCNISFPQLLAAFGKICVGLFAFNSGYATWQKRMEYNKYKNVLLRGAIFLISYWFICTLFICYAKIMDERVPDFSNFCLNIFGINTTPSAPYVNVAFAWYVTFYLFWLSIVPFILSIFQRRNSFFDIILLIIICFITNGAMEFTYYLNFINPLGTAICGLLCAKYNLFERLSKHININWWIALSIITTLIFTRQGLIFINAYHLGFEDGLFSFILIFTLLSIINRYKLTRTKSFMLTLGIYSMNIWYLHGIFFTGQCSIQKVLYFPQYWLLILLWGIFILLPLAFFCDRIQKSINYIPSYLFAKIKQRNSQKS